ncbi:MAG: 50S ribosomal protein L11 methyltransferase [Brevefilum sp.]
MSNRVHWIEIKIECDGEIAEALADVLGRFVSNGVVIESITRFNPKTQENEPIGRLSVSGYLAVNEDLEVKRQKLEEALWHLSQIQPIAKPEYKPIKDENWMEAWKAHYHPIPVGENLLIMPAWNQPDGDDEHTIIRINPAMAFGTGTHPTTQLCLRLLEKHMQKGIYVIDVGCGSGILSIAALKLGAAHVLAVDTDKQAVASTLDNAGINDLTPGLLESGQGSVKEILSGEFAIQNAPLVMVNILATVIIKLFDDGLAHLVQDGGVLLLSGILAPQEEEVRQTAKKAGLIQVDRLTEGDWVSLALIKQER